MEIESSADYVRMTRSALAAAGFVRSQAEDVVWWEGGPAEGASSGTIVFVHGVNDQAGTWFTVAPALVRTHRVILPDLRGHGESGPAAGPLTLPMLLHGIEVAIGAEQDITLVGNSLGGWVVLLYALRHPERIRHLILEAAGGLSLPFTTTIVATDRAEAVRILRAVHGPAFEPKDWVIEALLARAVDSPMLRITGAADHFLDQRLGELDVPATIIWGANDGVLSLDYAETLWKGIPGSMLRVIDDAAHIPHLQQPERYLACLTATF